MKTILYAVLTFTFALSATLAGAQEKGHLNVKTVVLKEEVVIDENGQSSTKLVEASKVVPGDEVIYTVTFANVSDEPAENIVITNPLPAEMTYIVGSAFGPGSDIVFSVDGGKTFAPAEDLSVEDDGIDRPARAEDYTHIRWLMNGEIIAGVQGIARFRARLN